MNKNFQFIFEPLKLFFNRFKYQNSIMAVIPFILGIFANSNIHNSASKSVFAVLIIIFLFVISVYKRYINKKSLFWLIFLPLGFFLNQYSLNNIKSNDFAKFYGEKVNYSGIVSTNPYIKNSNLHFDIHVKNINSDIINETARIKVKGGDSLNIEYGDSLFIENTRIRKPLEARNPGAFNYQRYLFNHGIFATSSIWNTEKIKILSKNNGSYFMRIFVIPFAKYVNTSIDKYCGNNGYLLKGILLGDKKGLPKDLKLDFKISGMSHILAVSGLHVGIILFIFYNIFVFLPFKIRVFLVISIIWFYTLVSGMGPSAIRASLMGSIVLLSWIFQKKGRIYNTIAFAALVLLFINPLFLFDAGFLLSFSATISIIYFYPLIKDLLSKFYDKSKLLDFVLNSIVISFAATIGTGLILATIFNRIALVSFLANIFVLPLLASLAGAGIAMLLFAKFSPFLATQYGTAVSLISSLNEWLISFFASFPFTGFDCTAGTFLLNLFYFPILIALFNFKKFRWARQYLFLLIFLFLNIIVWQSVFSKNKAVELTFLDVGQGDCSIINFGDGSCVIIDGGTGGLGDEIFDNGERTLYPYLRYNGINRIRYMIISHPHGDHIGGLIYILNNMKVDRVGDPGAESDEIQYADYLKIIKQKEIIHDTLKRGDYLDFGPELNSKILWPDTTINVNEISLNNTSIVVEMNVYNKKILFTGDAEKLVESLTYPYLSNCDVLKVAHHGSATSSKMSFLNLVKPDYSIIQCGRWNKYKHPHFSVLKNLDKVGSKVYRNDLNGGILIKIQDNKSLEIIPTIRL